MSDWRMRGLLTLVAVAAASTVMATTAAHAEVTVNESVPLDLAVFVPCANDGAGEIVVLNGDLHVLASFQINENNVSGKTHFQPQGVSGVGLATGDRYQGTGVTQGEFKSSLQNGQANSTSVNNFRIIGSGRGNNFLVHSTFHFTISAQGELTALADNFTVECR